MLWRLLVLNRMWKLHNGGFYSRRLSLGTEVIYPPFDIDIMKYMISIEAATHRKPLMAELVKRFIKSTEDNISTKKLSRG